MPAHYPVMGSDPLGGAIARNGTEHVHPAIPVHDPQSDTVLVCWVRARAMKIRECRRHPDRRRSPTNNGL